MAGRRCPSRRPPASLPRVTRALPLLWLLAACAGSSPAPEPMLGLAELAPDAEGRCWATEARLAVIDTEVLEESHAGDLRGGEVAGGAPVAYRSVIRQEVAPGRATAAFETLCPPAYTSDFVASLQRALLARGLYGGEVDGALGPALDRAIRDFQADTGPDSPLLSLDAARRLGLVPVSREQVARL